MKETVEIEELDYSKVPPSLLFYPFSPVSVLDELHPRSPVLLGVPRRIGPRRPFDHPPRSGAEQFSCPRIGRALPGQAICRRYSLFNWKEDALFRRGDGPRGRGPGLPEGRAQLRPRPLRHNGPVRDRPRSPR